MSDPEKEKRKTVYFVRHGQSTGNVTPAFQSLESPLSETGRAQAESVADRVARLPFDALVASPLQRTKETAEAIEKMTGKKIEFSDLFVERMKPKSINGKPFADEEATGLWREWVESLYTPGMRVEDGENFDDLIARADKALKFLESREEQTLVVVTHGYFLRTIVARVLLGDTLTADAFRNLQKSAATENTGITAIRHDDSFEEGRRWKLWIFNDHAHLG